MQHSWQRAARQREIEQAAAAVDPHETIAVDVVGGATVCAESLRQLFEHAHFPARVFVRGGGLVTPDDMPEGHGRQLLPALGPEESMRYLMRVEFPASFERNWDATLISIYRDVKAAALTIVPSPPENPDWPHFWVSQLRRQSFRHRPQAAAFPALCRLDEFSFWSPEDAAGRTGCWQVFSAVTMVRERCRPEPLPTPADAARRGGFAVALQHASHEEVFSKWGSMEDLPLLNESPSATESDSDTDTDEANPDAGDWVKIFG